MSSTEQPGVPSSTARSAAPPPSLARSRVGAQETLRTVSLPGLTLALRGRREDDGTDPAEDSRPAALYVHGLGGSSLNWSALMRELAPRVRGEALDLPGFGDSPPPDSGDYSVSGHARAVMRYLDSCGHSPVHLLGNSLGGAVTTRVAAVRPDLVRTLTLVSPALPEIPPQRTAWPTAMLAVPGIAALFNRLTRNWPPEQRVGGVLGLCYGDPARVAPEDFAAAAEEYARRVKLPYFWDAMVRSTRGIVDAYTLGGQHALWRQAERVLAPTLLVYGGRDQLVAFRMAQRASAAFRDSRLLTLPDGGHVAMMEYPEIVASAVRDLIDDTDAATRRMDDSSVGAGRQAPLTPEGD
jgi:pimeloyl-ACP methyl ester carboxylesterase